MLKIHRITDINDVYFEKMWSLYADAFPPSELRLRDDHKIALEDDSFYCMCYHEGDDVKALMFYWEFPHFCYVEYYAVDKNTRGQGLGTKILEDFAKTTKKILVLDIEEIVDEHTEKRWQFYKRLGFMKNKGIYMHPSYQKEYPPFPVHILSYNHVLTDEEYSLFIDKEKKIQLPE